MSYDSMLENMMAFVIAKNYGNVSEGLKMIQNAEQNRIKNSNKLPKDMSPNQEAFEALGFKFTDIGDDVLIEATLPEGWSKQEIPGSNILWQKLIDDKGRIRGKYCYNGAYYDRYGHMNLSCRYHLICQDTDSKDNRVNVVVTDADGSIIFNAGKCIKNCSKELEKLIEKAKEYLKSNYPEWEDFTKYWN